MGGLVLVAAACSANQSPTLEAVSSPTAVVGNVTPTPTPTATSRPAPSPTPAPPERACVADPAAYARRIALLEAAVADAMAGFAGTYGFALDDLDCATTAGVDPTYFQYTASTGKLPFMIAALRSVQQGRLELADIEGDLELVLRDSLDEPANRIIAMLDPATVREVLDLSGVSNQTTYRDSWSNYSSTPADLDRVWGALLRGELLDPNWADYLLSRLAGAVIPPEFETFPSPAGFEVAGLEYGQKAGYAILFAPPYYFVGSGFLRPTDGTSLGMAFSLVVSTPDGDLFDPQRRSVFPLVLEFAQEAFAEVAPPG